MTHHVILAGLTIALLAGCASAPDALAPQTDAHANPDAAASAAAPPLPSDEPPAAPASALCSVTVNAGVGVAARPAGPAGPSLTYLGCAFEKAAPGDLSRFASALVEASWKDPLPTVTAFDLFLLSESCDLGATEPCSHGHASSAAPLIRYEVPAQVLLDFGSDGLRAYATFEGVAVQQEVAIAITLVPPGASLPDGYSALP